MRTKHQAVSDQMLGLRGQYVEQLAERVRVLQPLAALSKWNDEQRAAVRMHAHQLSGTGTTYGFPLLTQAGRDLEAALMDQPAEDASYFSTRLAALLALCREALQTPAGAIAGEDAGKFKRNLLCEDNWVLIADDDEAVRTILADKFQAAGCKVVLADDGTKAWQMMQEIPVSLAVLDRTMPGVEGITLLRMTRQQASLKKLPVVLLTARHDGADVMHGFNTGASDYITKPFDPDEVVVRCLHLLKQQIEPQ